MIKILELAKKINSDVERINNFEENKKETEILKSIRDEIKNINNEFGQIINKSEIFIDNNIKISLPKSIKEIKINIEKISENFNKDKSSQSIKKKNYYQKVLEESKIYNKDNNEFLKNKWLEFCDNSYSGAKPNEIESNIVEIVNTDKNLNLLSKYRTKYSEYESLKKLSPQLNTFSRIKELGLKLSEIYSEFDQDAPEDVKKFLKAVNSPTGARLRMLNDTVINWIRDRNEINEYIIKRGK